MFSRDEFEREKLVFDPRDRKWYPPSECLWATHATRIPGKALISEHYASLKPFFTEILGIKEPTIRMYISALVKVSQSPAAPSDLKQRTRSISAMKPTPEDVEALSEACIFPVRKSDGSLCNVSLSDGFLIPDRLPLYDQFKDKVRMLEYSIKEIRDHKHLFRVMGIEDNGPRYLSAAATYKTQVDNGVHDTEQTRLFRRKAKAICRWVIASWIVQLHRRSHVSLF